MKKASKACFIIGIVVLALSAIAIISSFIMCPVRYTSRMGFFAVEYTNYTSVSGLKGLILGCTGIISGLLLFILSTILKLDCSAECGQKKEPCKPGKKYSGISAPAATEPKKPEAAPAPEEPAPAPEAKEPEPAPAPEAPAEAPAPAEQSEKE